MCVCAGFHWGKGDFAAMWFCYGRFVMLKFKWFFPTCQVRVSRFKERFKSSFFILILLASSFFLLDVTAGNRGPGSHSKCQLKWSNRSKKLTASSAAVWAHTDPKPIASTTAVLGTRETQAYRDRLSLGTHGPEAHRELWRSINHIG